MTVVLAGVINAADLNTDITSRVAAIAALNATRAADVYENCSCKALTTVLGVDQRLYDFTASDDMEVVSLGLSIWNPDATSRTASLTLSAINPFTQTTIAKYVPNAVSVSVSGAAAAEFNAVRTDFTAATTPLFLVKGLQYRLTFLRVDANAGVITNSQGVLVLRAFRRYM